MSPQPALRRRRAWALPLGRYFGVPVRVHWTFFLLILALGVWVGSAVGWSAAGNWLVTIVMLFGCVLLHELGHSVTAIFLGYGVKDITLLPIGGVARMEKLVRDPLDELMITAAGPMVNFIIAILLAIPLMTEWASFQAVPDVTSPYFTSNLFWLNIVLGIFNLLPAFPMDGGRILRSLLALFMSRLAATRVASALGQGVALLLILLGFLLNPWFILIGGFVLFAARAEGRAVELDEKMRGIRVGTVMIRDPFVLPDTGRLSEALQLARTTFQQDYPLVDTIGRLTGYVDRSVLLDPSSAASPEPPLTELAGPGVAVRPEDDLAETYGELASRGVGSAVVVDPMGRPIGLLPMEQIRKVMVYGWGAGSRKASPEDKLQGLEAG